MLRVGGIDELETVFPFAGKSVCIVTGELAGIDLNGGIGSYSRHLAASLAGNGAKVEILYANERFSGDRQASLPFLHTRGKLAREGIALSNIAEPSDILDRAHQSFLVMKHLQDAKPDFVLFGDINALGYYSLIARQTGDPQLFSVAMGVVAHGSTEWSNALNQIPLRTLNGVNIYEMERRCVELADVLISPSAFMIEHYRACGWKVPQNTLVLPNTILWTDGHRAANRKSPVDNITFFGRLEARKGLWIFCAALDRLRPQLRGKTVTFLGKTVLQNGVSTEKLIIRRSASWPCKVSIVSDYDSERALSFLRQNSGLAVMPSVEDNSPSVIVECMANGIPFIASDRGGGKELIDAGDRNKVLFSPTAASLAAKLADTFEKGCSPVKPSFDPAMGTGGYLQELEKHLAQADNRRSSAAAKKEKFDRLNYILLADEANGVEQIGAAVRKVFMSTDLKTEIVVLSEHPVPEEEAEKISHQVPGKVSFIGGGCDVDDVVGLMANTKNSITALSHIRQIVPVELVERAVRCFDTNPAVAGLTAMVANEYHEIRSASEPHPGGRPSKPVDDFLYSSSPIMLFLSTSSNAGAIVMQTQKFSELAEIAFRDQTSKKLKGAVDLIHEIILGLVGAGGDVEPVPDIFLPAGSNEVRTPTFDLIKVLRSSLKDIYGYRTGSNEELLARLAVEVAAVGMREKRQSEYLDQIRDILRDRIPPNHAIGDGSDSELILIANALSHRKTAHELLLKNCLPGLPSSGDLERVIEANAIAVHLFDIVQQNGNIRRINLSQDWSMKVWNDERKIELHPNDQNQGRAALEFGSLDLRKVDRFRCDIALPNVDSKPIRFRVDIITAERGKGLCRDCVLQPGASETWEIDISSCNAADSRIIISVETADPSANPSHCYTHWIDPLLYRSKPVED